MALEDYIASEIVLDCADGIFSRREGLRRLMLLGMTAPAAAAMLAACGDDDDDHGHGARARLGVRTGALVAETARHHGTAERSGSPVRRDGTDRGAVR